jgi:small subunit ribosomal protein S16
MALKIRLRQQGRTNRTCYRLVVTNSRSPRDGKYVEALGWYNPVETEADKILNLKSDRIQYWLDLGAQPTDKAQCLIRQMAPEVMRQFTEKKVAHRAKMAAKRKQKQAE